MNRLTVCQCNHLLGEKTTHPLVSVIDLSETGIKELLPVKVGFYGVLLREYASDCFAYGRKKCDYSDGTILFFSPGEFIDTQKSSGIHFTKGKLLVFHPELIYNTPLGVHIREYSFFMYRKEEALHLSEREKKIFTGCLNNIRDELWRPIDRHSRTLLSKFIELLLDYCTRFYDRQFITRCEENKRILQQVEQLIDEYYGMDGIEKVKNLPSAVFCAEQLYVSPAYFMDLFKQETGKTLEEYIQFRRIEIAKKWLLQTGMSVDGIARRLGYSSTPCFIRLFKKMAGIAPEECRDIN